MCHIRDPHHGRRNDRRKCPYHCAPETMIWAIWMEGVRNTTNCPKMVYIARHSVKTCGGRPYVVKLVVPCQQCDEVIYWFDRGLHYFFLPKKQSDYQEEVEEVRRPMRKVCVLEGMGYLSLSSNVSH